MLKARKPLIVRNLTGKVLAYATGRKLEATDRGEVDRIVSQLTKKIIFCVIWFTLWFKAIFFSPASCTFTSIYTPCW